jgi:monoamine oxidase
MANLGKYDVLVLGAGAAGLMAAKVLADADLAVCVVEARDRIGGRIWTVHEAGSDIPIELGAEFMHGHSPILFDMIKKHQLPHYEVDGDYWCAFEGELKPCDFWEKIEAVLNRMSADEPDVPFSEFLNKQSIDERTRQQVLSYIEGFEAAQPQRISLHALVNERNAAEEIEGDRAFRLSNGYDQIIGCLSHELKATIELNSVVKRVRWTRNRVVFEGEDQELEGKRALVTLPVAVLQSGSVLFEPPIEAKSRALSLIAAGPVIRVVIRFRERFWERMKANGKSLTDLSFLFSDDKLFPTWWSTMPVESSVLVGWSAGPHADSLVFRDQQFVLEQAISSLARKLRMDAAELRSLVQSFHFHDWQADPFSRGAYSYALAGGANAFGELAQPMEDTLFFAGEATNSEGFNGTVHGAIETGYRAAREVLRSLGHSEEQSVA